MTTIALILGAAVWPGGQPSPALQRRIDAALALWHQTSVDVIICCGGWGVHGPAEAQVIAQSLIQAGVPCAAVLEEDRSTNTVSNIVNALEICPQLRQAHGILVTDRYHSFRARLIARRLGLRVTCCCPPEHLLRRKTLIFARLRECAALIKTGWWMLRY
ncbi:hypothetical protein BFP70_16580 [Thioclava sp. SK-1]|uniref:YdcF family protein n=1 Tax=Thioclava sp. SK-1 TaxID=1889770 RepID=UPI000825776E|nr:YdcF family protein [Thioclava sp. SK-1]OCX61066.1 hypothetical protein BFP70_16580 [Thioclava sp. SK-1]